MQESLFDFNDVLYTKISNPFRHQLLKWIGNKQKFAHEIIKCFPDFNTYYEPFLGSGGVLGTLKPHRAVASDILAPLMEIWFCLSKEPELLKSWYEDRWIKMKSNDKKAFYEQVKQSYNRFPNGADLLFLSRTCYGGVIRFRKNDGFMSTPVGAHEPMHPRKFDIVVDIWHERTKDTVFQNEDFEKVLIDAKCGDLVYCDPPYYFSQSILYGSQKFSFHRLIEVIDYLKKKGVYVALSIDGSKHSGKTKWSLDIPKGLFEEQLIISNGRSMLKRFQMLGESLEEHEVTDRLLLTYRI